MGAGVLGLALRFWFWGSGNGVRSLFFGFGDGGVRDWGSGLGCSNPLHGWDLPARKVLGGARRGGVDAPKVEGKLGLAFGV